MNTTRPLDESVERTVAEAFDRFKDPVSPEEILKVIALNHLPAEFMEEKERNVSAQLKEVYEFIDEASKKDAPEAQGAIWRILEMSLESNATGWVSRRIIKNYDDSVKQIVFESKSVGIWIKRNRIGMHVVTLLGAQEMAAAATQAMSL